MPVCRNGSVAAGEYETCATGGSADYLADCGLGSAASYCGQGNSPSQDCVTGTDASTPYYCETGSAGVSDPNGCNAGPFH